MKFSSVAPLVLLTLLLTQLSAFAETLNTRLVEARNADPAKVAPGLEDVAPMLKAQLRYNSFALKGERNYPWKNGTGLALGDGYQMNLSEVEGSKATVELKRGDKILKMRVTLQPGRPLCLGPLSSDKDGALIVVLKLRN